MDTVKPTCLLPSWEGNTLIKDGLLICIGSLLILKSAGATGIIFHLKLDFISNTRNTEGGLLTDLKYGCYLKENDHT